MLNFAPLILHFAQNPYNFTANFAANFTAQILSQILRCKICCKIMGLADFVLLQILHNLAQFYIFRKSFRKYFAPWGSIFLSWLRSF